MGTILEATYTFNSQDKSSSNTLMGTHSHKVLVKNYHTPSHHPTRGTGAAGKDKAFPVQQCKLSTIQALAGAPPACAEVQQPEKSLSH